MTTHWYKNAPDRLIRAYEKREFINGRDILGRLLGKGSEWVKSPWTELRRHVHSDQQWVRVWTAIAYAKAKSNKAARSPHKTRSDERDEYQKLAKIFKKMADTIEDERLGLDVLTYELWGRKDWAALHVADLSKMATPERCDAAYQILSHWPSAADLLRGLERRATTFASGAMNKLRPDVRDKGDTEGRVFLWYLAEDFRLIFGKQMLGTLAKIANVTFNRVEKSQQFNKSFVRSAVRPV